MSSSATPADSPIGSPYARSPSQSSFSSVDETSTTKSEDAISEDAKPRPIVDTFGNEFTIPDYTMKQIYDAIPKHCFERRMIKSFSYVLRDLVLISLTFYIFYNYVTPETVPSKIVRAILWTGYTILQGLFGMGLWVLAHECGHQAFSESGFVNDLTGWVLHSALLVPFFSWKLSHAKHHKSTGNIAKDMAFVPKTREEYASKYQRTIHQLTELTEEAPITTIIGLFFQQCAGFPLYLFTNTTGHDNHEEHREGRGKGYKNGLFGGVNHFNPRSPLFDAKDKNAIVYSDIGLLLMGALLYQGVKSFGWANMLVWYFAPWAWVHHWLVAVTYLQHTDPSLPHYAPEGWTFTRGAAATIDRDFGFIGKHLFHDIIETHVLHHINSRIPFYNGREASAAIQPILGKHYRSDRKDGSRGFLRSLWTIARTCQWVEPVKGAEGENAHVLFYRNRNGIGLPPMTSKEE